MDKTTKTQVFYTCSLLFHMLKSLLLTLHFYDKKEQSTMSNILIIDDDIDLCNLMKHCVFNEGFTPVVAHTKKEAFSILNTYSNIIYLVILDIMLPDGSGLEILSHIHNNWNFPVIMVTAKDSLEDKVIGLRLGADDYLTKPFNLKELEARINALTRRYKLNISPSDSENNILQFNTLSINRATRSVLCNNTSVTLTGKEFDILLYLSSSPNTVYTKKQIYEAVWQEEYFYDDGSLMSIICKIRKKLKDCSPDINYIETIHGIGYRFNKEA